ncbi:MAG: DEAD/DEAH box helicase family protein [Actinobacteria bacterium]|nr:DEAD/DEAH box helicase family protein [Actinomycetota bacterium]
MPGPTFLRFTLSCLVDADHTDTARHYGNTIPDDEMPLNVEQRLAALDRYVSGLVADNDDSKERNSLRQQVYDACRTAPPAKNGLVACDSPVGTGKTTAVMAHLLNVAKQKGLRRVFVVLPFTNIIDQSVEVYRKALVLSEEDPEKVIAAHHHKAEFEEEANRAFSFLWNAPVTVTTAVQFFETLASNHPATLRKLHQLAGSAIFIDEAHAALPAHLWPQAWKWLQELVKDWGCYIVMASGSLTRFWELEEFSSPTMQLPELVASSVRASTMDAEQKRIIYRMKDEPLTLKELCEWIAELPGPRLIILNTVQSAAAVAREMAKRYGRDRVEHLSTALAPVHRKAIIDRIKKRLKDKNDTDWTLVATSCVEAGIDFSFKSAAREQCGLVSTIQTSGRVNRSGEFGTSKLWIFRIKTSDILKEHPAFKTSARILADLYREQKVSSDCCKEAMRREIRDLNQGLCENNPIIDAETARKFPEVEEKFKVIASNTISVLVDEKLRQRLEDSKRRKGVRPQELQQKTVAIYSWKAFQYGVMLLQGAGDLHYWTLEYDDFLGYMAGVLKLGDIESYVI